jgi:hypothetical protein
MIALGNDGENPISGQAEGDGGKEASKVRRLCGKSRRRKKGK